jgi:hypothetical protein
MNIYVVLIVIVALVALAIIFSYNLGVIFNIIGSGYCNDSERNGKRNDSERYDKRYDKRNGKRNGGKRNDIIKDLKTSPRTKSEQLVIDIFEKYTNEKFPTVLPKWLVYNNKQLELDGYCEKLALAVEFSGPLHTKWYPNKESHEKYLDRIKRDEAKIKICRDNNVRLFVIDMRIPRHQLHTYIKSRLSDVGLMEQPFNYMVEQIYAPDVDYSRS